jgi:hypothetical protein
LIPDEIQEHELMNTEEMQEVQMENDFVQLGFVGFPQADADPVFLQK